MKKLISGILFFALLGLSFASVSAELSVMTVDVESLYKDYYKTKEAEEKLKTRFETAQSQLQEMAASGDAEVEALKTMMEQAQNPALSDSAREQAEQDALAQREKLRSLQQELQLFQQSTTNQLNQQRATQQQFMLEEIKTVILEIAQEKGVDLVFDVSSRAIGLPSVIYANPAWDATIEVLAVLNADAPVIEPEASEE